MRTSFVPTRWVFSLLALTTLSGVTLRPAQAEPPVKHGVTTSTTSAPLDDHEKRIKELEETVRQLTRDQSQVQATLDTQKAAKPLAGWSDGFVLNSQDGRFKLKVGAYVQTDGRFFFDDEDNKAKSEFVVRRARLDLQGTVFRYFDFRLLPDFGGSSVQLYDAYLDLNYFSQAKLRVGKYKPPIGLERLQSATSLMFVERGLPTNLVPTRDIGLQLFGEFWDGALSYAGGVFNGAADLANSTGDVNDDKDFAGRVFAHPFKNTSLVFLRGLGLGIAGSYGRERGQTTNTDLPSYRTSGQQVFFNFKSASPADANNTAYAWGPHSRLAPQAYFYYGPFGSLFEYTSSNQEVSFKNNRQTFDNTAWQVALSYVVTGEPASYRGVSPVRPFDPSEGKWGAFEVAARGGQLHIDNAAFADGFADPAKSAGQASEWALGTNWYPNKSVKFVLNYANTYFNGGAKNGNRPTEKAILARIQLAF